MSQLQILVLALIQGITEYLPISSSGHSILVPAFTGWHDQGVLTDAITNLGTVCATIIYFYREVLMMLVGFADFVRRRASASSNLFQIVRRFHDHTPEDIRPSVSTSNAEELLFDRIDSGYIVSVATKEGTGRSATAQLLHASEAAFWSDLPLQMASLMQTVPDLADTEVIIESTANGYNDFRSQWRKAEAGESEFLPVFLPWSLDPGYRKELPEGFSMDAEESKLADLYDLDKEQIAWRRSKISQLGSPDWFAQEYPLTPSEAFISSTFDGFIPAGLIVKARKEKAEAYGPLIIGVDPAGMGADRASIAWRQGRCITKIESRKGLASRANRSARSVGELRVP